MSFERDWAVSLAEWDERQARLEAMGAVFREVLVALCVECGRSDLVARLRRDAWR